MAQDALEIVTAALHGRTKALNSVTAENAATRQRLEHRRGARSALACALASLTAAPPAPPPAAAASAPLERQQHHLQGLLGAREEALRALAFRRLQHAFMLARLEANEAALARYLAEAEAALA
jgi:septal ring factor EnvC (AmiA/AmiB activator)